MNRFINNPLGNILELAQAGYFLLNIGVFSLFITNFSATDRHEY